VREISVKSIWKRGGAAVNGWMGIPSSVATEGMAQAGRDSLTADLQHGLIDYQTAVSLFQAVATTPTIPLARVCEAFVGACRYAATGYRSVGPTHALWLHGADYVKNANDTVLTFAMIEPRKAKAAVGAMREGNVTGGQSTGKSAGGSMY